MSLEQSIDTLTEAIIKHRAVMESIDKKLGDLHVSLTGKIEGLPPAKVEALPPAKPAAPEVPLMPEPAKAAPVPAEPKKKATPKATAAPAASGNMKDPATELPVTKEEVLKAARDFMAAGGTKEQVSDFINKQGIIKFNEATPAQLEKLLTALQAETNVLKVDEPKDDLADLL